MAKAAKRLTEIDRQLRKQVGSKFLEIVDTKFRGNRSEAARALGLTRQRFQLYLEEKFTPGLEILGLSCELWGIEFAVGNIRLTAQHLRKNKAFVERATP